MKFREVEDGFLVRLEKGEEVMGTLTKFVKEREIKAGFVTGMGAITDATVGLFDTEKKEYLKKTFKNDLEVGNLTANISYLDDTGEPFVHAHVTVSDGSLCAFTGHLFKATVSVTMEIYIRAFGKRLIRKKDPEAGLNFWQP